MTTTNTTTNATQNTTTTNIEKEATTMKSTTSINLANGTQISKREFKRRTFEAYIHYVRFIEQQETIQTALKYLKPIFADFGITFDQHSWTSVTMYLTSYGSLQGEKVRKVKSITTFQKFLLGGYQEMISKRVVSHAGKAPAEPKTKTTKAKKPTKDQQIAALKAELAAAKEQIAKVQG